jgi:HEAT repeat protein
LLKKLRVKSNITRLIKGISKHKKKIVKLDGTNNIVNLIEVLDYLSSVLDKPSNICRDNLSEQSTVCEAAIALGQLGNLRAVEPLIKVSKLFYSNKSVSCAIINSLGQLGSARSIEVLLSYLDFTSPEVHEAALKELMRIGDAIPVDTLILASESKYPNKRVAIAKILGQLGNVNSIEPLISLLGDSREGGHDVRNAAATALSKLGEPKWLNYIKGNNNDFVRLGKSGDWRIIDILIKASINYPIEAAEGLMHLKDPRAAKILIKKLDFYERCFQYSMESNYAELYTNECLDTLAVLAKLGDVSLVGPVSKMLDCKHYPVVIQGAAKALCQMRNASAADSLVKQLAHWNENVRRTVADSLAKLGEPKWLDYVQGTDDDFIRLAKSRDQRVFKPLISVADSIYRYGNDEISRKIIDVLSEDTGAVEPLIKVLNDENENVIGKIATECLGRLGDLRAVEPLIKALNNSTYEGLQAVAARSLGKLKDARAIKHLEKVILSDRAGWVKEEATESLRQLGETRVIDIIEKEEELLQAVKNNDEEKVILLLNSVDPTTCVSLSNGDTLLHDICRGNNNPDIISALIAKGIDVNSKNKNLETPLHIASCFGLEVTVKSLIGNGANVNVKDECGKTPLHNAAYHLNYKNARLLLDNGADVNLIDKKNNTPLYVLWNSHEGLELDLKKKIGDLFVMHEGIINK